MTPGLSHSARGQGADDPQAGSLCAPRAGGAREPGRSVNYPAGGRSEFRRRLSPALLCCLHFPPPFTSPSCVAITGGLWRRSAKGLSHFHWYSETHAADVTPLQRSGQGVEGSVHLTARANMTFRVFVSSTFNDFRAERNALLQRERVCVFSDRL